MLLYLRRVPHPTTNSGYVPYLLLICPLRQRHFNLVRVLWVFNEIGSNLSRTGFNYIGSSHLTSYPGALLKLLFENGTFSILRWVEFKTKNAKPIFYVRFSSRLLVLLVVLTPTLVYFNPDVFGGAALWTLVRVLHFHFVKGLRNFMGDWFICANPYRLLPLLSSFHEKSLKWVRL